MKYFSYCAICIGKISLYLGEIAKIVPKLSSSAPFCPSIIKNANLIPKLYKCIRFRLYAELERHAGPATPRPLRNALAGDLQGAHAAACAAPGEAARAAPCATSWPASCAAPSRLPARRTTWCPCDARRGFLAGASSQRAWLGGEHSIRQGGADECSGLCAGNRKNRDASWVKWIFDHEMQS